SHALEAVRSLCRRVLWLDKGRLVADGPAGDVIDQYLTYENAKHAERMRVQHSTATPHSTVHTPQALIAPPQPLTAADAEKLDASVEAGTGGPAESQAGQKIDLLRGIARITDVQFLDGNGEETLTFLTEKPMTIRIFYE